MNPSYGRISALTQGADTYLNMISKVPSVEYEEVEIGKERKDANIVAIRFDTCDNTLACRLLKHDSFGQWWCIACNTLPVRFCCLKDRSTVTKFATKFGFLDGNACLNYKKGVYEKVDDLGEYLHDVPSLYGKLYEACKRLAPHIVRGIRQEKKNSGICWFSAMCFAAFFCDSLRDIFTPHSSDVTLTHLIKTCLVDVKAAEALRSHLYDYYALGDDPKQDPEKDGQNGTSQLLILVSKLKIPCECLMSPNLSPFTHVQKDQAGIDCPLIPLDNASEGILIVRCFRTKYKPPLFIEYKNKTFKLASIMIGSEQCQHQIAVATCNLKAGRLVISDSDAIRLGQGPMYFKIPRLRGEDSVQYGNKWWRIMDSIIPVTLMNSDSYCEFSIHNHATCKLNQKMNGDRCDTENAGLVNCDFIYVLKHS